MRVTNFSSDKNRLQLRVESHELESADGRFAIKNPGLPYEQAKLAELMSSLQIHTVRKVSQDYANRFVALVAKLALVKAYENIPAGEKVLAECNAQLLHFQTYYEFLTEKVTEWMHVEAETEESKALAFRILSEAPHEKVVLLDHSVQQIRRAKILDRGAHYDQTTQAVLAATSNALHIIFGHRHWVEYQVDSMLLSLSKAA